MKLSRRPARRPVAARTIYLACAALAVAGLAVAARRRRSLPPASIEVPLPDLPGGREATPYQSAGNPIGSAISAVR
ncbi:hypothetical protein [Micromonospora sp. WMMD737]|uniref:hypothetical protein n=1 Tax=Micromonospora sp. WMMD737 TaxID=3404113 RepID=UPI003B93482A